MLTTKQFDSLQIGDIILYHGKPRTIREIDRRQTNWGIRRSITFSILRRSWTNRIYTVYGYNDIKHSLSLPRKVRERRAVCKAEEESLLASGFDVASEIDREIAEDVRLTGLGMGAPRQAKALLKQAQRKFKRRKKTIL